MTHFENEMTDLKEKLLLMASWLRGGDQVHQSAGRSRRRLARAVIEEDTAIDRLEMEIDEIAIALLSKLRSRRPASDHRGDESVARPRARGGRGNLDRPTGNRFGPGTAAQTLHRYPAHDDHGHGDVKGCLDAFVSAIRKSPRRDSRDKEVDALNKQLHRELASYMVEKPNTITRCLGLMVISKRLERIADHAKNVAEEVVFLYEARYSSHRSSNTKSKCSAQSE